MSDNLMEKVSAFGERLKIGGAEVGRKIEAGVSSMSFKMKELFQGPNQADKVVEEATSEALEDPDWATNLEICDMVNTEKINSVDLIRGIKKRIMLKNPRVQYLALVLLETLAKNCEKAFSEIAAERVLDEMVKLIDDPQTVVNNRNKALILIEAWGESAGELRYLPVYEETYKAGFYDEKLSKWKVKPIKLASTELAHSINLVASDSTYVVPRVGVEKCNYRFRAPLSFAAARSPTTKIPNNLWYLELGLRSAITDSELPYLLRLLEVLQLRSLIIKLMNGDGRTNECLHGGEEPYESLCVSSYFSQPSYHSFAFWAQHFLVKTGSS